MTKRILSMALLLAVVFSLAIPANADTIHIIFNNPDDIVNLIPLSPIGVYETEQSLPKNKAEIYKFLSRSDIESLVIEEIPVERGKNGFNVNEKTFQSAQFGKKLTSAMERDWIIPVISPSDQENGWYNGVFKLKNSNNQPKPSVFVTSDFSHESLEQLKMLGVGSESLVVNIENELFGTGSDGQ